MIGRNRRGFRQASMRARIGIAAAVLAGGGAIATVAVAANNGSAATAAQSAGYEQGGRASMPGALSYTLSSWAGHQTGALSALSDVAPVRRFAVAWQGHTAFAVQSGTVTKTSAHALLVTSKNGSAHLWLVNGFTRFKNVAGSPAGTKAVTGGTMAGQPGVQIAQGDKVLVVGLVYQGRLWARVVLFLAPAVTPPTTAPPSMMPTGTASATPTMTPPMTPTTKPPTTAPPTKQPTPPAPPTQPAPPSSTPPTFSGPHS